MDRMISFVDSLSEFPLLIIFHVTETDDIFDKMRGVITFNDVCNNEFINTKIHLQMR